MASTSRSSAAGSPLLATVPARGWLDDLPPGAGHQQLGAGADEAGDAEDHARGVQRQESAEDVRRDQRAVGLDADFPCQHHLLQVATPNRRHRLRHLVPPLFMGAHRHQREPVRRLDRRQGGDGGGVRRGQFPDRRDRGEPAVAGGVGADQHRRDHQARRAPTVEGEGAEGEGPAPPADHVILHLDGAEGLHHPRRRLRSGQAAGEGDLQRLAPSRQHQAVPLPEHGIGGPPTWSGSSSARRSGRGSVRATSRLARTTTAPPLTVNPGRSAPVWQGPATPRGPGGRAGRAGRRHRPRRHGFRSGHGRGGRGHPGRRDQLGDPTREEASFGGGEAGPPQARQHLRRVRQVGNRAWQVPVRVGVGEHGADPRCHLAEIDGVAGPQQRVGGHRHVEQSQPPPGTDHAGQLLEHGVEVGEVAQGETAHHSVDGPVRERQAGSIALDERVGGVGMGEHPERQVDADRPVARAGQLAAQIPGAAGQVHDQRPPSQAEAMHRPPAPALVHSKGHQPVDQVVPGGDGVEHGPDGAHLGVALRERGARRHV